MVLAFLARSPEIGPGGPTVGVRSLSMLVLARERRSAAGRSISGFRRAARRTSSPIRKNYVSTVPATGKSRGGKGQGLMGDCLSRRVRRATSSPWPSTRQSRSGGPAVQVAASAIRQPRDRIEKSRGRSLVLLPVTRPVTERNGALMSHPLGTGAHETGEPDMALEELLHRLDAGALACT